MNYINLYIYYPKKTNSHLKILPQFPFSCRPIQVQDDQVSRLVWVHLHHKIKTKTSIWAKENSKIILPLPFWASQAWAWAFALNRQTAIYSRTRKNVKALGGALETLGTMKCVLIFVSGLSSTLPGDLNCDQLLPMWQKVINKTSKTKLKDFHDLSLLFPLYAEIPT